MDSETAMRHVMDSETATRHVMDSETLVEHRYGQRGKNSGGNVKYGTDT